VKKPQRRFSDAASDLCVRIFKNYRAIVRIFPDLETWYDFKATVAGPFTTLPVTE